jgi:hypothetical protein
MSDKQNPLDDMSINIELTIRGFNVLMAILDLPQQAPTTMKAEMMNILHNQVTPQIEQAKKGLEAALKASEEASNG